MRYEKFILQKHQIPVPSELNGDVIYGVKHDISELQACENLGQCRVVEAIFYTVCELFERSDIELLTTSYSHSFALVVKEESAFNTLQCLQSPELSREKLRGASSDDIAKAVIDMIVHSDKWNVEKRYQTIHID